VHFSELNLHQALSVHVLINQLAGILTNLLLYLFDSSHPDFVKWSGTAFGCPWQYHGPQNCTSWSGGSVGPDAGRKADHHCEGRSGDQQPASDCDSCQDHPRNAGCTGQFLDITAIVSQIYPAHLLNLPSALIYWS